MNLFPLITIGFSLLLVASGAYLLGYEACKEKQLEERTKATNYSKEDIALANYLTKRQAINENYLHTQKELLKILAETKK
jgi:hypothetical protein